MLVSKSSHPRYAWKVTWREGAKRRQRYFSGERAAREFAARTRPQAAKFAPSDVAATPEELRLLARAREAGVPLGEALDLWEKTVGTGKAVTVADLVKRRLASMTGSKSHKWDTKRKLEKLAKAMGDARVQAVTGLDLRPLMEAEKSRASQVHTRAVFSALFALAVADGILASNPAAGLKPTLERPDKPVAIWTGAQADAWLAVVREEAPEILAGWAIAFFAGLRLSEVERLDWTRVKLARGHIEVFAKKTKSRRLVTVCAKLKTLLGPLAKAAGPVWPKTTRRLKARCERVLGVVMPGNVARHSFVSHHLAFHQNIALTELEAGHSKSVMFQHYRELVTREEAAAYFDVKIPAPAAGPGAAE